MILFKKILSWIFYGIAISLFAFVLSMELNPQFMPQPAFIVVMSIFICGATIAGTLLRINGLIDTVKKKKTIRITICLLFIYYVSYLIYILFLDSAFGRGGYSLFSGYMDYRTHLKYATNFIPFKEISAYLTNMFRGSFRYSVVNIFGNLIAFSPMGFFLPVLFKKLRKFIPFIIVTVGIIAAVEALQFLLLVGRCDIDDLMLNSIGAIIAYFIFRLKFFQNMFYKLEIL